MRFTRPPGPSRRPATARKPGPRGHNPAAPGPGPVAPLWLAVAAADLSALALLAYALGPRAPDGALTHALPGVAALLAGSATATLLEGRRWDRAAWEWLTALEAVAAALLLAWDGFGLVSLLLLAATAAALARRPQG